MSLVKVGPTPAFMFARVLAAEGAASVSATPARGRWVIA
jgi:hypothetical protein